MAGEHVQQQWRATENDDMLKSTDTKPLHTVTNVYGLAMQHAHDMGWGVSEEQTPSGGRW